MRENPRRKPATLSDVKRAKREAVRFAWGAFMLALGDVLGLDKEDMQRVWRRLNDYWQDYLDGKLTIRKIHETLLTEYEIKLIEEE